jgi:serine/threonine protein kinase
MGEVYRARDAKLQRDVALKVLSARLASTAEARARFEREALSVARLSHPSIVSIYEFGDHNGLAGSMIDCKRRLRLWSRVVRDAQRRAGV